MFQEAIARSGERYGAITRIARQLGVAPESRRKWVMQADSDGGARVGVTTEDKARIQELERANRELGRANEILKTDVGFFARELDPRLPRL
jgi:transposase